jgi:hypothetical protein
MSNWQSAGKLFTTKCSAACISNAIEVRVAAKWHVLPKLVHIGVQSKNEKLELHACATHGKIAIVPDL